MSYSCGRRVVYGAQIYMYKVSAKKLICKLVDFAVNSCGETVSSAYEFALLYSAILENF